MSSVWNGNFGILLKRTVKATMEEERKRPKLRYREADTINESDYFRWLKTYLEKMPSTEAKLKVLWYVCRPENRKNTVEEDLQEMLEIYGDKLEIVEKYMDEGNFFSDELDNRVEFRKVREFARKEKLPILIPSVDKFVRSELYCPDDPFERLTVRDIKNIADDIMGLTLLVFMKPSLSGGALASKVKTTLKENEQETLQWVELHNAGYGWTAIAEKVFGKSTRTLQDRIRQRVKDYLKKHGY